MESHTTLSVILRCNSTMPNIMMRDPMIQSYIMQSSILSSNRVVIL